MCRRFLLLHLFKILYTLSYFIQLWAADLTYIHLFETVLTVFRSRLFFNIQILHVEVKFLSSIYHFLKSYTDTVICFTAKQKYEAKISDSEFANAAKVQKTENRDVG